MRYQKKRYLFPLHIFFIFGFFSPQGISFRIFIVGFYCGRLQSTKSPFAFGKETERYTTYTILYSGLFAFPEGDSSLVQLLGRFLFSNETFYKMALRPSPLRSHGNHCRFNGLFLLRNQGRNGKIILLYQMRAHNRLVNGERDGGSTRHEISLNGTQLFGGENFVKLAHSHLKHKKATTASTKAKQLVLLLVL